MSDLLINTDPIPKDVSVFNSAPQHEAVGGTGGIIPFLLNPRQYGDVNGQLLAPE
jgi:hypothetical protein